MADIYNPTVKLTVREVGKVWAKLDSPSTKQVFDFLVNPTDLTWSHTATHTELAVLYTGQPQLSYKNSTSKLSMPNVLMWTPGNSGSLRDIQATLVSFTKPVAGATTPPLLRLIWGNLSEPRLYLSSFSMKETQWRGGDVTQATASFEFLVVPLPPTITKSANPQQLSTREQKDYEASVRSTLKKDKTLATKLGIDPTKAVISVSPDFVLSVDNKKLGTLQSVLPSLVKPVHKF